MVIHKRTPEEFRVREAVSNFVSDNSDILDKLCFIEQDQLEEALFKLVLSVAEDSVEVLKVFRQEELNNTILENDKKLKGREV